MAEELGHREIQELLGAYALDAVDDDERAGIEAHLEACESCLAELGDHRRLAETLRRHAIRVSPLASTESNGSARSAGPAAHRGRLGRWGVLVAVAVVVLLEGALLAEGHLRYDRLAAAASRIELIERAQLASADPAAVVTALRTPGDGPALTVVDRGGGSFAINASLPRLAGGRSYQLWRVDSAAVTAVVALGPDPDVVEFSLPAGASGFVVTAETSPAPSRPTLPAIASSAGVSF